MNLLSPSSEGETPAKAATGFVLCLCVYGRTPQEEIDVHHEETFIPQNIPAGRRRHDRAAVFGIDGSSTNAFGENGWHAGSTLRLRVRTARIDYEGLDAGKRGPGV